MDNVRFSVWVGGVEVNDYYLTLKDARKIAVEYIKDGYDDVQIEGLRVEN